MDEQGRAPSVQSVRHAGGKGRIFTFLSVPSSSRPAEIYSWYMDALALLSILSFCFESVTRWSSTVEQRIVFFTIESFVSVNFLVDLTLKLATQPSLKTYTISWDFLVDLFSISPWGFDIFRMNELLENGAPVKSHYSLRLLRLLRFIRFFKITLGNVPQMRLFLRAVKRSGLALAFLLVYVLGAGLFFSGCLYYAETSSCTLNRSTGLWMEDVGASKTPQPCVIQSMFHAIWLCLVTMTTVGYGDLVPMTPLGKGIATLIMVTSMIFLPLPAAIFGANLTELYLEERLPRRLERRKKLCEEGLSGSPSECSPLYGHHLCRHQSRYSHPYGALGEEHCRDASPTDLVPTE